MTDYPVPLHVSIVTKLFNNHYPLYRFIYFVYKYFADRQVLAFFKKTIKMAPPDGVILDIGANIGFYSLFFARNAPPTAHIIAFEPIPDNVKRLREEVLPHKNLIVAPFAVSDASREIDMAVSSNSTIDHHIQARENTHSSNDTVTRLQAVALDDYCCDLSSVDIIKMDIQGGEYLALRGMRKLLERSPGVVIVTELWPWGLARAGAYWQDFFSLLEELSMQARAFDSRDLWSFCRDNESNSHGYTNIVITRKHM